MNFSILQGRIDIIEPGEQPREYERFTISVNPDSSRSLTTVTWAPKGDLLRQTNQRVTKEWRPIDASGRLFFKGKDFGTVIRRIDGKILRSWVWAPDSTEPDYAEFEAPDNMSVGFHPIIHDAWKMAFMDTSHNDAQELITHTVSQTWNGSSLGHGVQLRSLSRFIGKESISTPAGDLECDKFLWSSPFDKELEVWRTGPHHILARMHVAKGDKEGTVYQLAKLEETNVP